MTQFRCDICGEGFDQKSALERHLQTSHPRQAPNAIDLSSALKNLEFPINKEDLVQELSKQGEEELAEEAKEFRVEQFRDSAEVTRAFGEKKSHRQKPSRQPSKLGGRRS